MITGGLNWKEVREMKGEGRIGNRRETPMLSLWEAWGA